MEISITDAIDQLEALVDRAEAGEEVILTESGKAVVRLVPVKPVFKATPEPNADDEGLLK